MLDRVGNPRAVLLRAVRRGVLRHRRRGHQKVGRSQGHQRLVTLGQILVHITGTGVPVQGQVLRLVLIVLSKVSSNAILNFLFVGFV